MKYVLVALTHGAAEPLADTLASFRTHVQPAPEVLYLHGDGEQAQGATYEWATSHAWPGMLMSLGGSYEPEGFCAATRESWLTVAAFPDVDYVFWLEHDFRFLRHVDLADLAALLDANPRLAQVALMRDAVNEQERAAGGLFESRPGQYEPRDVKTFYDPIGEGLVRGWDVATWLEQKAYFSTNPSLMRRAFMAENPWPVYGSECEGKFGIDLLARGYTFGVYGSGEPWVEHVGVRTGSGY